MKLARRSRFAIFDLDGVLLDTEPLYTDATAQVAARFGKIYDWSVKRDCIGRGTLEAARIIVDALALPLSPEALVVERERVLTDLRRARARDRRAPNRSRARSRRAGCRSPSPPAPRRRCSRSRPPRHRGWLSIFRAAVCGDDPRVARSKPAPDIFLAAAQDLGAPPAGVCVFEDSPVRRRGGARRRDAGDRAARSRDGPRALHERRCGREPTSRRCIRTHSDFDGLTFRERLTLPRGGCPCRVVAPELQDPLRDLQSRRASQR